MTTEFKKLFIEMSTRELIGELISDAQYLGFALNELDDEQAKEFKREGRIVAWECRIKHLNDCILEAKNILLARCAHDTNEVPEKE